ncbi:MAG: T9SS C-terminal target domain-containing protein, partial [Bacteroidetes bacterium]
VSISPNPASDFINLEYGFEQGTDLSVRVLNSLGQVMIQKDLTGVLAGTEQIAISSLPGGAYFVLLSNGKGTFAQKLIVR